MRRLVSLLLALLLTACTPVQPVQNTDPTPDSTQNPPDSSDIVLPEPDTSADPEDDKVEEAPPVLETRTDSTSPMLDSLTIDGGYSLDFSPELRTYSLRIPAGRPRVPKLTASAADGLEVEVVQAVIPDSRIWGMGTVYVTDAQGTEGTYEVLIVKDETLGFQLQYLDRWTFAPEGVAEGSKVEFVSSNPNVIEVAADGTMTAKSLSSAPVTVDAKVNGSVVDSLTVDKVVNMVINICLITGQSNASGTLDIPSGVSEADYTAKEMKDVLCPDPGTSFCIDVNMVGSIQKPLYDLSEGRIGFSPALGKTWYDLTGEKTLMLQTAVGGSPIEAWTKPENGVRYAYLYSNANFYETTLSAYRYCMNSIGYAGSGYEINNTFAFWCQGGTGTVHTFNPNKVSAGVGDWDWGSKAHIVSAQEYYDLFSKNMEYFRNELNVDFMGILLVRNFEESSSLESIALQLHTDLTTARAAQYALNCDGTSDVGLVSLVANIARKETYADRTVEGWGYMGCNNVHYNQEGHNANGVAAAENTFARIYGGDARKATGIDWMKTNGRDLFAEGETLTLKAGQVYQSAAMVLPVYTDTAQLIFTSADPAVCTVDQLGTITAVGSTGASTTVTVSCPGTDLTVTISVTITE